MNEQMTASHLLPEQSYMPIEVSRPDVSPVYFERRITFAPNTYASTAAYEADASAHVPALGEVASKFAGIAKPAEHSYVEATAADMEMARQAYLEQYAPKATEAEIAARRQAEIEMLNSWFGILNDSEEETDGASVKILARV